MRPLQAPALALSLVASLATGCAPEPATYVYGVNLADVDFDLYATDMGVHPSTSVLDAPENVFADGGVSTDMKWEILDAGHWPATFYAWATVLTYEHIGEAQFYTATAAKAVYDRRDCDPQHLYYVRQIALDGFQVVLDEFPDSATYDATGEIAYPLAPLAYAAIEDLGGTPEGWTLVTGDDGTVALIPTDVE